VLGRHLHDRLEPQLVEFDRASSGPFVVGLVDRHQDRHRGRPEPGGDLLVPGNEPFAAVDDEHDDVGRLDCAAAADHDELVQRIFLRAEHPPCVHQRERNSLPLSRLRDHVARRPWNRGDDRPPRIGDPVEER
jgi:hypothetical protein